MYAPASSGVGGASAPASPARNPVQNANGSSDGIPSRETSTPMVVGTDNVGSSWMMGGIVTYPADAVKHKCQHHAS